MLTQFKDKTVVITGGATGIGFAIACQFGADGAKIVIGEPRENRMQEAVEKLAGGGIEARYTVCDVTDLASVEALADFAATTFGSVDVLLNNAGVSLGNSPLVDTPMEQVRKVMDVNFFGVWHGCRVFGRRMIDQGTPAAIFNVASENSFFCAVPQAADYIASKHAVFALTDSFREDVPDHIHVGAIFPGWVASELMPEQVRQFAMDTDKFAEIVMKQIKAGEHYIVSHAYNMERINARMSEVENAFAKYAPRYEGDDEYDVRTVMAKLAGQR